MTIKTPRTALELETAQQRADLIAVAHLLLQLTKDLHEATLTGQYSEALGLLEATSQPRAGLHMALANQIRKARANAA